MNKDKCAQVRDSLVSQNALVSSGGVNAVSSQSLACEQIASGLSPGILTPFRAIPLYHNSLWMPVYILSLMITCELAYVCVCV